MSTENKSLNDLLMALITKTNDNANIFPSTKELMQAKNLVEGQYVICLGYNSINDGCRTSFKIVKGKASEDPYNPNLELTGSPGLRAELIVENDTINMLQLGGRPMSPDSVNDKGIKDPNYKFDNKPAFQRYIDLIRKNLNGNAKYKLYIPPGIWCTSPVNITCAVYIEGYQGTWEQLHNLGSTTITAMGDQAHIFAIRPYFNGIDDLTQNQDHKYTADDRRYVNYNDAFEYYHNDLYSGIKKEDLTFDQESEILDKISDQKILSPQAYTLKNLVFSSGDFQYQSRYGDSHKKELYRSNPNTNYRITHSALRLHNTNFGTFDNISFHHIWGRCITIKTCWELRFTGNLCMLECCNPGDALISFLKVDSTSDGYQTSTPNISNIEIYNVNIEATIGDIFKTEFGCTLQDTLIQNIHIEPGYTCWLFTACADERDNNYKKNQKWIYHSRNEIRNLHLQLLNNILNKKPNLREAITLTLECENSSLNQESLDHRMLSATGHEWIIWNCYPDNGVTKEVLKATRPAAVKIPENAPSATSWWENLYAGANDTGPFPIPYTETNISVGSFGKRLLNRAIQYNSKYSTNLEAEQILQYSSVYSFIEDEFKYFSEKATSMSIFNIQGTSNFVVNNIIINNIAYRKWAYIATKTQAGYNSEEWYTYNSLFTISKPPAYNNEINPDGMPEYEGQDYIGLGVNVGNVQAGGIFDTCSILKTDYPKIARTSYFTLNSCGYSSSSDTSKDGELLFDVKNFPIIICNGSVRNLARTPLNPLSNDFNPCYKHSQAINADAKSGFLCYDKDSINDLKLVVQPKNTFCNCMAFTVKNNKLNIRAKIPNNKYVTLNLYGNSDMTDNMYDDIGGPITLQGLGTYAWYSIDLSTIDFARKYYIDMNLNDGSTRKQEINRNNNPIIYIRVRPPKINEEWDPDMLDGDNIKAFFDVFYLGEDTWYETPPSTT